MRTVLAFGTFDLLHLGHVKYLEAAKRFGDRLVVVVARDEAVKKLKGIDAYFTERERLEMVKSLRIVDEAVLGDGLKSFYQFRVVDRVKPGVVVFGYDQKEAEECLRERLEKNGLKTVVVRMKKPYRPLRYKSSAIRRICFRV